MDNMNQSVYEKTIADLEAQLSRFELESEMLKQTRLDHSTPKDSDRKTFTDSGFETKRLSNAGPPEYLRDNSVAKESTGGEEKPTKKQSKEIPDQYDLSPYLQKAPKQRVSLEDEVETGITYRRPKQEHRAKDKKRQSEQFWTSERDIREYPERSVQFDMPRTAVGGGKPNIKPATYDGTSSWQDYKSHFDACAMLGKWSKVERGLYLAVSLRGQAQGVLGNLSGDALNDYDELVRALNERFAPPNQTELYRAQLRERTKKATESLPELGQSVRRLTNLAYPTAPYDVRETLAKEQFLDALIDSDMRLRIKQARPRDLNEAIRHAVELEAYAKAEKTDTEKRGYYRPIGSAEKTNELSELTKLVENMGTVMDDMRQEIKQLKENQSQFQKYHPPGKPKAENSADWKKQATCHNCGKKGHIQRDCRAPKRDINARKDVKESGRKVEERPQSSKQFASKDHKKKVPGRVGIEHSNNDPGFYVKTSIHGTTVKMLVDTGATVTLISKEVYERTGQENLKSIKREILSANGEPIKVFGKTQIKLELNKRTYVNTAAVADISVDGVLGLDFMINNRCTIDIYRKKMCVAGDEVQLFVEGEIGCYRIALSNTLSIPPRSEIITLGEACLNEKETVPIGFGLIEPDETFIKSDNGLVGKALVHGDGKLPIRIMNLSTDSKVLHKGTVVATLTPVEDIIENTEETSLSNNRKLNPALDDLFKRSSKNLSSGEKQKVREMLLKHSTLFATDSKDFGKTDIIKHKINTGTSAPIKEPLRRIPVHMRAEVDKHIDDMLEQGVIEPSTSPWAAGIVLVKKKDGSTRFCVDYRKLNAATIKDSYPLPRIDESLDHLSGASLFSTLDMCSGYWQVEVDPKDKPKTAFATKRGLFQFRVMPFGLCNAPATFERLVETILSGLQWEICLVYLDDIIVIAKSFDEMMLNLETIFSRLRAAGLKLKSSKCLLFSETVEYLGHIISKQGVVTDPKKIETVRDWPEPCNVTEVRSFLGLCSYYRRFIKDFASIAKPLHKLTEKSKGFVWTSQCQDSFETLKSMLTNTPILAFPDFSEPFILDTDASDGAIGAVLSQIQDGNEKVIAYASRSLTKSERNYCVTKKELLAIVTFVKYFRHYLYGKKFTIRTDHSSLRWLLKFKNPEGQLARWLEVLSLYDMTIEHRAGTKHRNADALSRRPCKRCKFDPEWETHHLMVLKSLCPDQKSEEERIQYDTRSLCELQKNDKDIRDIRRWLESKEQPDSKDLNSGGVMIKSLWAQREMLVIQNDMLFRRLKNKNADIFQAVVPMNQRRNVLQYSHDQKTAGHLGIRKTLSKIRQSYYWPGLQKDVRQYIAGCTVCSKRKCPTKTKRAPIQLVGAGLPMERVAMDILGELPTTEKGNKYILVISDYFTKWTEAIAMPNIEAKTVAEIFVKEVVTRLGVPTSLYSDQGAQFESKLFTEMCKLLHIKKTHTSPYHPQSDGMVERFNKTLATMLSSYVNEYHTDWDEYLPFVMMAYRSVEHETTGCSPNYLMLGREVGTPIDLMYEMPTRIKTIPTNQWAWELKERMEIAHKIARQNANEAMLRQKALHDHKLNWQTFKPGDEVYVFFPRYKPGQSPKFTSFWKGPFKVLKKFTDVNYEVDCGPRGRSQIIHVDRMRMKKEQILQNEKAATKVEVSNNDQESSDKEVISKSENEREYELEPPNDVSLPKTHGRVRRPPQWLKDYVVDD